MASLTTLTTAGPSRLVCKVCYAIDIEPFGQALQAALDSDATHADIARADELTALPYRVGQGAIGTHRSGNCSGKAA